MLSGMPVRESTVDQGKRALGLKGASHLFGNGSLHSLESLVSCVPEMQYEFRFSWWVGDVTSPIQGMLDMSHMPSRSATKFISSHILPGLLPPQGLLCDSLLCGQAQDTGLLHPLPGRCHIPDHKQPGAAGRHHTHL